MKETLSDIGEFGLIHRIDKLIRREGRHSEGLILGIGDDAAAVQSREGFETLITCDSVVEGRHYVPEFMRYFDIGRRAMTLNISDIGAMGGQPLYAMVSLGLKSGMLASDVEELYRGFLAELNPFSASIIGGNITKVDGATFIDITLVGEIKKGNRLLRSTAKPGDTIFVTGFPGEAAAGLELLMRKTRENISSNHPLIQAYISPMHRAREGFAIASSGYATAMIDTSDGLLADLAHLCMDSGVGAELKRNDLPISSALKDYAVQNKHDPFDLCTKDSDDYELVMTCAPKNDKKIRETLANISEVPVSAIGTLTEHAGDFYWILPDGSKQHFTPKGWDHFHSMEADD